MVNIQEFTKQEMFKKKKKTLKMESENRFLQINIELSKLFNVK